jgi:arginase family enzyme
MAAQQRLAFLGCPLDSDERQAAVDEKRACLGAGQDDPYDAVLDLLRQELDQSLWREAGRLEVPTWLRPRPALSDGGAMTVDNFVDFIDRWGCADFTDSARKMTEQAAFPDTPCLIAVDHCLAGGIIQAASQRHGAENLSVVVLDSHLDALTTPVLSGAIAYDLEHNPDTQYDAYDPFLHDRPDSYHASSFLQHLLATEAVLPSNLLVVGISDYPPKHAFRNKDPRIQAYTGAYSGLKKQGVRLVTKKDLAVGSSKVRALFKRIKTSWLYVSIDMDVGANNAVGAVRFDDWAGLSETQLYRLAAELRAVLARGVGLAGLDVCEFNPRRVGMGDRTYRVAANLIKALAFGHKPSA